MHSSLLDRHAIGEARTSQVVKVVTGKPCSPPSLTERQLLEALDRVVQALPDVKLFVPDLAQAAGLEERAEIERRRMSMIQES